LVTDPITGRSAVWGWRAFSDGWSGHCLMRSDLRSGPARTISGVLCLHALALFYNVLSSSLWKKGTGSERHVGTSGIIRCREAPVPLFQQAASADVAIRTPCDSRILRLTFLVVLALVTLSSVTASATEPIPSHVRD